MKAETGELEGLDRFHLTGQWIMPPGGLPGAAMTGKFTIQRICKKTGMKFTG
jgi:phytoene desaturase